MNSFPVILLVVLLGGSGPMTCYANGQGNLAVEDVEAWLEAYEEAWEKLDPEKAALIFTEDATYQVDPYSEPYIGRDAIYGYWATVTSDQKDVDFTAEVLAVTEDTGIAHWHSEFTQDSSGASIILDGIFVLKFSDDGKCESLKEWWSIKQ